MLALSADLCAALQAAATPVILLEGTRHLPDTDHAILQRIATRLFEQFPHAIFRSGYAESTDTIFANAIARLDTARLQLVLPHAGMGRARRPAGAACFSLDTVPPDELESLAAITGQAGRDAGRLADYYLRGPEARKTAVGNKAAYLLRNTLKVVGSTKLGLSPAALGIFRVNPTDPSGGGTGHTIKVCEIQRLPHMNQACDQGWAAFNGS